MKKYIVFDIGGSAVKCALMDRNGILEKHKFNTPKDSLRKLIDSMKDVIHQYSHVISGVAISMPGVIRPEDGMVIHGGAISYFKGNSIKSILEEETEYTIEIENDSKSAAQGEIWQGNFKDVQSGVMLTLGTGVGGAIVFDGEVVRGHHQGAGEFSYIRTDRHHPHRNSDTFGFTGSTVELVERASEVTSSFIPKENFTGEMLFDHIREGNTELRKVVEDFADDLATQIASLQTVLDPELFVIGGGMSQQDLFIEIIQERMHAFYEQDVIPGFEPKIVQSHLGNDANLYGALYHYLKVNKEV